MLPFEKLLNIFYSQIWLNIFLWIMATLDTSQNGGEKRKEKKALIHNA
jgi:hypothetical protein